MDALGRATGLQLSLAERRVFDAGAGCVAVQQLNVFSANEDALARCEAHDLAVLARSPLAMGFLSGKYRSCDQPLPPAMSAGQRHIGTTCRPLPAPSTVAAVCGRGTSFRHSALCP